MQDQTQELRRHLRRLIACLDEAVRFARETNSTDHNAGMWMTAIDEAEECLRIEPYSEQEATA